ncbi:tetratricopeptide repeat protein [Oceanicoccus sagamiensis]|uniref:MSHA biogenesis protein MshN n=1 Tax=Oceanicoccus sagamiensis TaxID=716816 RepID=A0A1X9NAY2_9GAMM|nr:hypothetical protein [Oceanicoccus sagamiensis]ARN73592.1 hypothetical protein BST96_05335 [Oceanicoccus sagamiensis]
MSLVNDMLNDLDDRRNQQAREEVNLDWMTGQKQTSKNKWLMPLLSLAVIVLFIVVAFSVFQYQTTANSSAIDKLAAIKKPVAEKPVKPEVVAVEKQREPVETVVPSVVEVAPVAKAIVTSPVQKPVASKSLPKASPPPAAAKKPIKKQKPLSLPQRDLIASQEAKKLIRNNQSVVAEEKLAAFMQKNPLAIRSGKVLASLWLSQKKEAQAQQLLVPLRDIAPRDIELIMIQARLFYAAGNPLEAIALMKTERPAVNVHAGYYELLGFIARSDQQYELSVQSYRRLLEYDASRGDWWVGMAIALDMQSKSALAKEAYRRGIDSRRISKSLNDYARKRLAAL